MPPLPSPTPSSPMVGPSNKRRRIAGPEIRDQETASESSTADTDVRSRKGNRPDYIQLHVGQSAAPLESDLVSDIESEAEAASDEERPRKSTYRALSHVSECGPAFPRSFYDAYDEKGRRVPLASAMRERDALSELQAAYEKQCAALEERPEYIFFRLDDFTVYRPEHKTHAGQLCSLNQLNNRGGYDEFLFDGVLSVGNERRVVRGVRFSVLTIDGYGDSEVTNMTDRLCIQSRAARNADVWYQLGTPAQEYVRFFEPFLWLAQFTKYFLDYLLETENVTLQNFRRDFHGWLFARYSALPTFRAWLRQCGLRNFRTTVAAHVGFLWKECYSIAGEESSLLEHPIWGEVDPQKLTAIPRQPQNEKFTVVTPLMYECFKHMYFAEHLEARNISDKATRVAVFDRKAKLGLTHFQSQNRGNRGLLTPRSMSEDSSASGAIDVRVGDVVCIEPDGSSGWKSTSTTWYAYVQNIRESKSGTKLDAIWLYESSDTTLGAAYYPFPNELFMSDNCACGRDAIEASSVIGKAKVEFFVQTLAQQQGFVQQEGLFVRQKFRTIHDDDTYDFVSLKSTDFHCACQNPVNIWDECRANFPIGSNVLFRNYNYMLREDSLEPGQIVDFLLDKQRVVLRRFQRKSDFDPGARANELLGTEDLVEKTPSRIIRHCQIRKFHSEIVQEGLPTPYDQNGAGDLFFIVEDSGSSTPAEEEQNMLAKGIVLPPLEKGWDPETAPPTKKLKGMGIFCGGGNFDRGLEDAGAVGFEYAIDYAGPALHTYLANSRDPARVKPFLGSVDDHLARAMARDTRTSEVIAPIGEVEVLAAGSPCPGFSRANNNKLDAQALRNSSMVASVVSYVDLYSPQYCLLENVVTMTQGMGPKKDENVFAQILAAFVAMGYQVQQFLMDAWSFGSSQGRSRVFIIASAPGLTPFAAPPCTHSHPREMKQTKLGKSSNGRPFGVRRDEFTPFKPVTALQATSDLPHVGDSLPQLCTRYPDHRTPSEDSTLARLCMAVVPNHPRGMGFVQAVYAFQNCKDEEQRWCSRITGLAFEWYETKIQRNKMRNQEKSTVYARISPDGLFPTFMTKIQCNDAFNGRCLHWDQPRHLTIMEARRGQGFLDHEVVVGSPLSQVRIIGNSVDRKVSLALGLCLRTSWLANASGGNNAATAIEEPSNSVSDDEE